MRPLNSYNKIQNLVSSLIRCRPLFNRAKGLYLNVGCGPNARPNFINLDYHWAPGVNICWDITKKPLPIKDNSIMGIHTEHCLEHLSMEGCEYALKEFYRVLNPGGAARIIVPDGEIYLKNYSEGKQVPYADKYLTPMQAVNRVFYKDHHRFIYDFETMKLLLLRAGFSKVEKLSYKVGRPALVELDTPWREVESLYVEAVK